MNYPQISTTNPQRLVTIYGWNYPAFTPQGAEFRAELYEARLRRKYPVVRLIDGRWVRVEKSN